MSKPSAIKVCSNLSDSGVLEALQSFVPCEDNSVFGAKRAEAARAMAELNVGLDDRDRVGLVDPVARILALNKLDIGTHDVAELAVFLARAGFTLEKMLRFVRLGDAALIGAAGEQEGSDEEKGLFRHALSSYNSGLVLAHGRHGSYVDGVRATVPPLIRHGEDVLAVVRHLRAQASEQAPVLMMN